jgi:hypothetical protein
MATSYFPQIIQFAQVNIAAGATFGCFPTNGNPGAPYTGLVLPPDPFVVVPTEYRFPRMNTRQMVFLNVGGNPVLFGTAYANDAITVFAPFGPGQQISTALGQFGPSEGINCTRLPAGASLSIDLDTYERRGNFDPTMPLNIGAQTASPPVMIPFFFGIGGLAGQVDITYVNTYGAF